MMENQSFTCPNPSCGRAFPSPLRTEDLGSNKRQPYDACPYCLTEIMVEASTLGVEEQKTDDGKSDKNQTTQELTDEKPAYSSTSTQGCTHHIGYLSERSSKEKIPEECMMCANIVQCMLKKVTG
jgi:hypothetical protein